MSKRKTSKPPVLRSDDDLALWPTRKGDKAALFGYATIDGHTLLVRAFINDTDKEGNKLAQPYLSLTTNTAADGKPAKWKNVAYGNAVNGCDDGKDVYFDQIIFHVAGSEETFPAYAGRGMTDDLHRELGFTSPQIPRPAKEDAPTQENGVREHIRLER
jgi:hypothetical protein